MVTIPQVWISQQACSTCLNEFWFYNFPGKKTETFAYHHRQNAIYTWSLPRSLRERSGNYFWTSHNAILVLVSARKWHWRRASLIYPPEIVATIRQLYPGDIKNYPPQSRKVRKNYSVWNQKRFVILLIRFFSLSLSLSLSLKPKNLYEVQLQELIGAYNEEDLRQCWRKGRKSLPVSIVCNCCSIWDVGKPCLHFLAWGHTVFFDFFLEVLL